MQPVIMLVTSGNTEQIQYVSRIRRQIDQRNRSPILRNMVIRIRRVDFDDTQAVISDK